MNLLFGCLVTFAIICGFIALASFFGWLCHKHDCYACKRSDERCEDLHELFEAAFNVVHRTCYEDKAAKDRLEKAIDEYIKYTTKD